MDDKRFMTDLETLRAKLQTLQQEHRDLDDVIHNLEDGQSADQLLIQRMKKRKLSLKDQISVLESQVIPDIIA